MGLLLFILSIILLIPSLPIGIEYTLISILFSKFPIRIKNKEVNIYFRKLAIAVDQLGNVLMGPLFNKILITKESKHKFSNVDETISSVIGKNKLDNALTNLGRWLANFLNRQEKDHVEKAIEKDETDCTKENL